MAKLNGVKTLDMKNGEITKVAYNGEEYVRVADRAEKGDLLLSEFDHFDIDEGAFYVCDSVYRYGILLYDNNGDLRDRNHGEFKVFRKISASIPPTIEKRVDDLELRVSALEGDKAETIEFEGEKYRKVDREAREGDVVIFRDTGGYIFEVGKTYKVGENVRIADEHGYKHAVYRTRLRRTRETVDVYEPIAESKTQATKSYKPKVGDIVVVTGNTNWSRNAVGDIGKVGKQRTEKTYEVHVPGKSKGNGNCTYIDEMRPATAEEIAQYETAVANLELKAWAKIGRKVNEFKKGDIVKGYSKYHQKFAMGIVEDVSGKLIGIRLPNDEYYAIENNELIAPVESLFQR